jgi:hypothetical protein
MDENIKQVNLPHFLADTWWFALTKRLNDDNFLKLVKTREEQGFTAAQIVVGIPPEVGLYNENAKSIYGSAWDKSGQINNAYLALAKKRVGIMNKHHITAIIYGAWGHQIEWIGTDKMIKWWKAIIETLDEYDVIYCLTGEIDIWSEPIMSKCLLPDKTTQTIIPNSFCFQQGIKLLYHKLFSSNKMNKQKRFKKWTTVLNTIKNYTDKPIFVHTLPCSSGFSVIEDMDLLSANTFQTGHTRESAINLWKNIYQSKTQFPNKPVINLEPYYEGIHNDFFEKWQLYAFWLSVASGCHSICYGAHGIWNVGDGQFLAQWGKQTFDEALTFHTPEILGKSYQFLLHYGILDWNRISIKTTGEELISITRMSNDGKKITYIPEITKCNVIPNGKYVKIETVDFVPHLPDKGSIVILH